MNEERATEIRLKSISTISDAFIKLKPPCSNVSIVLVKDPFTRLSPEMKAQAIKQQPDILNLKDKIGTMYVGESNEILVIDKPYSKFEDREDILDVVTKAHILQAWACKFMEELDLTSEKPQDNLTVSQYVGAYIAHRMEDSVLEQFMITSDPVPRPDWKPKDGIPKEIKEQLITCLFVLFSEMREDESDE